ncbi:MAG: RNA polymerase sigma factor [Actinocrinis sp.]
MEPNDSAAPALDEASAEWISVLTATGPDRDAGLARLHDLLLRVAVHELRRRESNSGVAGAELDDLAHQAAADAMLAVLDKLGTFRGESRFTTWVYRFVVLEVSNKLGRHYWRRHPATALDAEDWERLPDRLGVAPDEHAEGVELAGLLRMAIDEALTDHQRELFVAIVIDGTPLDALVAKLGKSRGTIYKVVFDARRKIRAYLVANGYLNEQSLNGQGLNGQNPDKQSLDGRGANEASLDEGRRRS